MSMTVAVPLELESFVRSKLTSGAYTDASELVGDALRRMQSDGDDGGWPHTDEEKERVRQMIEVGWQQAREGKLLTPEEVRTSMAAMKERWKRERGVA